MSNQQQYDYYKPLMQAHFEQCFDTVKEAYAHLVSGGADSNCCHEAKALFLALTRIQVELCACMNNAASTAPNVTVASAPGPKRNPDITVTP